MNDAVNQHFVPQMLLRRWANDKDEVWMYRTLVSHASVHDWRRVSVKTAASQRYFYGQDGFENDVNGRIESAAAPAIEAAVGGARIIPEHWKNLIAFVALQLMRTPKAFLKIAQIMRDDFVPFVKASVEEASRLGHVPSAPAVYDPNHPMKVYRDPESGATTIAADIGPEGWRGVVRNEVDNFAERMFQHRWTVLRTPPGRDLYLSDEPAISSPDNPEVFLPLSPHHLLYTDVQSGRMLPRGTRISVHDVDRFNTRIAQSANLAVFAVDRRDTLPRFRPRTVDPEGYVREVDYWRKFHQLPPDEVSTSLHVDPEWYEKLKQSMESETPTERDGSSSEQGGGDDH